MCVAGVGAGGVGESLGMLDAARRKRVAEVIAHSLPRERSSQRHTVLPDHVAGAHATWHVSLRTCIPHGQLSEHTAYQAERCAHRPAGAALCYSHVRGPGRALAVGIQ